ncbi:hypothetical protein Patl1_31729 [Pistacia atlantica]|uniref:Uncharacterized protein n=1 Tax=Pistacia atlantica TaxID=434234 RepID=A0ACC1AR36_9ROSI|nr:hypothetical protein Patl1_31729 [Pistacia atlantica]
MEGGTSQFDIERFRLRDPVFINGEILHRYVSSDEKSIGMYLPDSAGKTNECRNNLLEMGGNLAFVYTVSDTQLDVKRKTKMENVQRNKDIDALPHLPEEIIFEILKRVPAKYLHEKFRYVCKRWHNLISSSMFIAQNIPQNKSKLLHGVPTNKGKTVFSVGELVMDVDSALDIKMNHIPTSRMGYIRSSCNGLILVDDPKEEGILYVMNLLTKSCATLPECPSHCPHPYVSCGAALGFDPLTREYKVVHIGEDNLFEILTLGSSDNAWKTIPGPFEHSLERPIDFVRWTDPVSINGQVLHWDVETNDYIISMNISNEKWIKLELPGFAKKTERGFYLLVEMGGKLALVYSVSTTQIDIWILEDFEGKNWVKRHSIMADSVTYINRFKPSVPFKTAPNFKYLVVVATLRDGELMVFDHGFYSGSLYLYDVKKRELKELGMESNLSSYLIPHRDSLICWKNEKDLLEKRLSSQTSP